MVPRVDAVEAAAFADLYAAMPSSLADFMQPRVERLGGATALLLPALPVPIYNRVIGFGVHQPADPAQLDTIVDLYRQASASPAWLHIQPTARPAELRTWLAERGFALAKPSTWAQVLRGTNPPPQIATDFRVGPVEAGREREFGAVLAKAHRMPPMMAAWMQALVGRPRWHAYAAVREGDRIVAGGFLFVEEDFGWLALGGTLPEFRMGGAHGALMSLRIRAAIALGCGFVATETAEPSRVEINHSLSNMYRMGFRKISSRYNYELAVG